MPAATSPWRSTTVDPDRVPRSGGRAGRAVDLQRTAARPARGGRSRQDRFNLSDLRYKNGAASYLDLLDAQRSLFQAQQAAVQANLQRLQNQVTLYRVLGGGWSEPGSPVSGALTRSRRLT